MNVGKWGWPALGAGIGAACGGAWITATQTWWSGAVLTLIGAFVTGAGLIGITRPWRDSVDEEIDRWERNWRSEWEPQCPVHGVTLCYTRTRQCPDTRQRVP